MWDLRRASPAGDRIIKELFGGKKARLSSFSEVRSSERGGAEERGERPREPGERMVRRISRKVMWRREAVQAGRGAVGGTAKTAI